MIEKFRCIRLKKRGFNEERAVDFSTISVQMRPIRLVQMKREQSK